jgi:hypothetical protein
MLLHYLKGGGRAGVVNLSKPKPMQGGEIGGQVLFRFYAAIAVTVTSCHL